MLNFIQIKTTTFQSHCRENEMASLRKKSLTIDAPDKEFECKVYEQFCSPIAPQSRKIMSKAFELTCHNIKSTKGQYTPVKRAQKLAVMLKWTMRHYYRSIRVSEINKGAKVTVGKDVNHNLTHFWSRWKMTSTPWRAVWNHKALCRSNRHVRFTYSRNSSVLQWEKHLPRE